MGPLLDWEGNVLMQNNEVGVKGEFPPRALATPSLFEFSCLLSPHNPRKFWDGQRGASVPQILQKKSKAVASKLAEIIRAYRFWLTDRVRGQNNPEDHPALRRVLWPSQIKAVMGQGTFGPHRLQSPLLILFSSYSSPLCLRSADRPLFSSRRG